MRIRFNPLNVRKNWFLRGDGYRRRKNAIKSPVTNGQRRRHLNSCFASLYKEKSGRFDLRPDYKCNLQALSRLYTSEDVCVSVATGLTRSKTFARVEGQPSICSVPAPFWRRCETPENGLRKGMKNRSGTLVTVKCFAELEVKKTNRMTAVFVVPCNTAFS